MTRTALRWELRKLAAQRRTALGLGAAAAAPILLAIAIVVHPPEPDRHRDPVLPALSPSSPASPCRW